MDTLTQSPHYEFMNITGVVLESNSWTETHVSGGGGGGSHGIYHADSIRSHSVAKGEMWLRDESGQEHHLKYNGTVPVRTGHIVTALYARVKSKKPEEYTQIAYYNHATSNLIKLEGGIEGLAYTALPAWRHAGFWLAPLWLLLFISAFFERHKGDAILACLFIGLFAFFVSWVITGPQVASLKRKLSNLLDQHFQNVPRIDPASYAVAAA